jgi:hypothetical protein
VGKYRVLAGIVALLFVPTISNAQNNSTVNKLTNIHKIYIGDLGNQEGADLVREEIRLRLLKSDRFSVVERPEVADAGLTGVAGVVRSTTAVKTDSANGAVSGGRTVLSGVGIVRLVDTKTEETIWVYEYKPGFSFKGASVADKTVDQLLKDAQPSKKK